MVPRRKGRLSERAKLDATPPWETRIRDEPTPTTGPWDERDAPEDSVPRVDLGALRVPVGPGMDVRLEMNEAQQVIGVTLVGREGHLQLGVFAAPRNEGHLGRGPRRDRRRAQRAEGRGPRGTIGSVRCGTARHRARRGRRPTPVRFIGVDGPRWFLRAMLVGAVATDSGKAARFERALRDIVVVRGTDPLPAREAVPLRLPKEIVANPDDAEAGG